MKASFELIQKATVSASLKINNKTSLEIREMILVEELEKVGITNFTSVGEVFAKGANFSIMEMKGKFRVNFRCGYGRNNYAPCIEISK